MLAGLAEQFEVHANQIAQWNSRLQERACDEFATAAEHSESAGPDVKVLHAEIGQLAMERTLKSAEEQGAFWRGHWAAWAISGLRQRAYCARHGLSYAAFGYWRNRVHEKPAVPVVIEPPELAALPVAAVLARVIRLLEQVPC